MLIAIISDIHDNIPNLKKVLVYCRKNQIEKIICCGDLATMETLDFLNDNFVGKIFFTFGNMDEEHIEDYFINSDRQGSGFRIKSGMTMYKHTEIFPDFGQIEIEDKRIAFVHYPDAARQLCESGEYNFVFHGHTHKPWTEVISNCTLLNPGNVANQYYPPTFAIWDTRKNSFELVRINELE